MKKIIFILALLMNMVGLTACSSDGDEKLDGNLSTHLGGMWTIEKFDGKLGKTYERQTIDFVSGTVTWTGETTGDAPDMLWGHYKVVGNDILISTSEAFNPKTDPYNDIKLHVTYFDGGNLHFKASYKTQSEYYVKSAECKRVWGD